MTIKELIMALSHVNQDATVCIDLNTEDGGSYSDFEIDADCADEKSGSLVSIRPNDLVS